MNFIEKINAVPRSVKASLALFCARVVTSGIAYITTPIFTRLLTAEEYGQVSVFLSWQQVFGIVAMFNLAGGVFNNGMLDFPERRSEYSLSMLGLSNAITLAFSAMLLLGYGFFRTWIGLDYPLVILMCVMFLVQPAYNFWFTRQRYELRYKSTAFWSIVCALLSPMVAAVCILAFPQARIYARLFGGELTLILIYIGFYIYLFVRAKGRMTTEYWKTALLFNLPLLPHYLSVNLLHNSDRVMISRLMGDAATAHYSVAYSVASVVLIVWSAANGSLVPFTYEKCKERDFKAISKVTMPILTGFAFCCIMLIMLAPEIVALMATPDYKEAIYVIPPIVGGVFFQTHYSVYGNVIYYYKKPKYVMYASVASTALNIGLNWIFIPRFGFVAAGYTTLFSYFIQAVIDYIGLRKVVSESVYDMRYLGALSLAMILISLLCNLIYDHILIRYITLLVIVVVCAVIAVNRNNSCRDSKRDKTTD